MPINVCLSCDENYSKYAAVTVASILSNAGKDDDLHFYILDGGISDESKNKILSLKNIKDCSIDFVIVNERDFDDYKNLQTNAYISIPTYFRLKLSTLLPEVKRIIYFDCDVVVLTSLRELFETDLGNNVFAGVNDIDAAKLKNNPSYVNAGVLLLDLDKVRELGIENEFLEYTREHFNEIKLGDQDIINQVLENKILCIDSAYNVQSEDFIHRSSFTKNPKIIHFVCSKKPWHFASWSYHKDLYFKYLQLTPWKIPENELFWYWMVWNKFMAVLTFVKHRPLFFLRKDFLRAFFKTYIFIEK